MKPHNLPDKHPSCLHGRGCILQRQEVNHLGQSIHHHEDGRASFPMGGNSTTMLMALILHGLSGTGSGWSRPQAQFLVPLLPVQTAQEFTNLLQLSSRSSQQNVRFFWTLK